MLYAVLYKWCTGLSAQVQVHGCIDSNHTTQDPVNVDYVYISSQERQSHQRQ